MTVYRNFDQEELDAQYNCRAMCPDAETWVAYYKEASDSAVATFNCDLDVSYGPSEPEKLDIFVAEGSQNPVMVFIHGGYWRAMDKDVHRFMAHAFVPAGITLVTVNYALAPSVRMDEIVRQNRAAISWVYRNAGSFGGDPSQIYVSGHSAGGHLTAMMMATDWPTFDHDLPHDVVKGGCPISGLYDLEPIRHTYLNEDVRLDEEEAVRNSPCRYSPRGPSWMVITAGGSESEEFHRLQDELVSNWSESDLGVTVVDSPGMHHFSIVAELGNGASPLVRAIQSKIQKEN